MAFRFDLPRFLLAPVDAEGAGGDEAEDLDDTEAPDEGDEGVDEVEDDGGKDDADDKGKQSKKPEKKAGGEKGAKDKGEKGKKGAADKAGQKKTLISGQEKVGADDTSDDKGKGKGKGKVGKSSGDELDAWTPTLPDGQKADEELLGEARTLAKQHGLKGEQLQGFVDLGVKMQAKVTQALVQAHEAAVEGYEKAARADPEIGGAKLEAAVESALATIDRFAGKAAKSVVAELERTGLGSHPEVIRMLAAIDKATREDDTLARTRGKGGAHGDQSSDPMKRFTQQMYPKMTKQLAKERGEDVDDD